MLDLLTSSSVIVSSWSQSSIYHLPHSLIVSAFNCLPVRPSSTPLLFLLFLPDLEQHLFILLCLPCHIIFHLVSHISLTLSQHQVNKSLFLSFDVTDEIVNDLIITVERRNVPNIVKDFLPFWKLGTAWFCLQLFLFWNPWGSLQVGCLWYFWRCFAKKNRSCFVSLLKLSSGLTSSFLLDNSW